MSSDSISVTLEPRQVTGKAVKHLRSEGIVPAVIHDHGKDSIHVQGEYLDLIKVWQKAGKHHPVEVVAGNKKFVALIRTAEFDPKKHRLTHVVFNAVDRNQKVEAEVPIRPKYAEGNDSSPAERNSLIVLSQLETVQVKATPDRLPNFLEYDAEKLIEVGDSVAVSDLAIPDGVDLMTEAEHAVATVYEPSALAAANDAAGGDAEEETAADESSDDGTESSDNEAKPEEKAENKEGNKEPEGE